MREVMNFEDIREEEYYKLMKSCCKQCEQCTYYWENTDTENECDGEDEICHEFIEVEAENE